MRYLCQYFRIKTPVTYKGGSLEGKDIMGVVTEYSTVILM